MRICLISTGQPSSNPRLVKEADALTAAGFDVRVIGAYWSDWATAEDVRLLQRRSWMFTFVDWRASTHPVLFWKTRVRHYLAPACVGWPLADIWAVPAAIGRVTPELSRAALATPADLYIAHNLGALPAAAAAARRHHARLGFDAEDFHRGMFAPATADGRLRLTTRVEDTLLPRCDYVTAASPAIARAYAPLCHSEPVSILNVFPLGMRPAERRPTTSDGPVTLYWFSQTIGPGRGLEDVVKAMARFPNGRLELHLRGRVEPGFVGVLGRVARAAGLESSQLVFHPPAAPDDMATVASQYDVGLASEPGTPLNNDLAASNKLFTYLLAGNAVLATRTTGQHDVLSELSDAGALYAPGDVDGLASALGVWVADRARLDAARLTSWQWGASRFNWDLERERFLDVVRGVLNLEPAPAAERRGVRLAAQTTVAPRT